jgi:ubiquinone/menaquinone biosynthesis C-methylase UbiE
MTKKIADDWIVHPYYEHAENYLATFWGEESIFRKMFKQLDCKLIVELACGHGRHVPKYINDAQTITLIDVNDENIKFCKNRFNNEKKIEYIITETGNNFGHIPDNSKTAIFCYDAMVHFELIDIFYYLQDAFRILKAQGKILFHHSNFSANPGSFYQKNPHWRNYMSADIFTYLAVRSGFNIISQNLISWGAGEQLTYNIDCLSLCQKPIKN